MNLLTTLKSVAPTGLREQAKGLVRTLGNASSPLRPPPDFLVIGTKRGGTTSLWNWLLQHPSVLPLLPSVQNLKSAHYFYWHYDEGPGWYRGFFPLEATRRVSHLRHGVAPVSGEASPYYLMDPRVPGRVASAVPHVKIVILLRDPVERAYSHYRERVHEGVEPLTFRDALAAEDDRLAGELERMAAEPYYYSRPHDWYSYRRRGIYAPQLRRWQVIPPAQTLIIRSEDLYADPQPTYDTVTGFLGLPEHALDAKRYNYHPAAGIPDDVRESLAAFYQPHNAALYEMLGRDLGWTLPST